MCLSSEDGSPILMLPFVRPLGENNRLADARLLHEDILERHEGGDPGVSCVGVAAERDYVQRATTAHFDHQPEKLAKWPIFHTRY